MMPSWGIDFPRSTLLLVALATLGLGVAASRIELDNTPDTWLPSVDVALEDYHGFRERFGEDSLLLVAIEPDVRDPAAFDEGLLGFAEALEALPGVAAVEAPERDPGHAQGILRSPLGSHLVSEQGDLLAMALLPEPSLSASERTALAAEVRRVADTWAGGLGRIRLAGTDVITHDLDRGSQRSLAGLAPFVVVIMCVVLWGATRSLWAVLATILAVVGSSVWALGLVALAGRSLNLVLVVLPAILAVLTTAQAMHLLARFRALSEKDSAASSDRDQRIGWWREAIEKTWRPCLLSALTTAAGFASLGVSEIPPVRDLGVFTAAGVLVSFALTFLLLPAVLVHRRTMRPAEASRWWTEGRARGFAAWLGARSGVILLLAIAVFAGALLGLDRLRLESHILQFFPPDHRVPQNYGVIEDRLVGLTPFEIWVEGPRTEMLEPGLLGAIDQTLTRALGEEELITDVLSPFDLPALREHAASVSADRRPDLLPTSPKLLPPGLDRYIFVDEETIAYRFTLTARTASSNECDALARRLRGIVADTFAIDGETRVRVTGAASLLIHGQVLLLRTQVASFATALLTVLVVIYAALRSARLLLASVLANLLPVALTLGGMGFLGVPLNTATVTVAGIALGIIIDDTIHILYAYGRARREGAAANLAVAQTLLHVGPPIFLTTVAVAVGFGAFAFSPFRPTLYFGTLIAATSVAALVCDLLVLPAFLQRIDTALETAEAQPISSVPLGRR